MVIKKGTVLKKNSSCIASTKVGFWMTVRTTKHYKLERTSINHRVQKKKNYLEKSLICAGKFLSCLYSCYTFLESEIMKQTLPRHHPYTGTTKIYIMLFNTQICKYFNMIFRHYVAK